MTRKIYIQTFGCQMNDHDSDRIRRQLGADSYTITDNEKEADAVILNTCSVRDKAEKKVLSRIGRLKLLKESKPDLIISVAGCMAQRMGKQLLDDYSHINLVFGTHVIPSVSYLLGRAFNGERLVDISEKGIDAFNFMEIPEKGALEESVTANVTIMNGCDNFCSYCIVPYVRGPEVSRKPDDILGEVVYLVSRGVKEITLLGQNVNSYGNKSTFNMSFSELLKKVDAIPELERLRFVTSHPKDLSDDLIGLFGELRTLCEHIHLPLQSGSDKILEMMNRKYTVRQYMKIIDKLRKRCPDIAITTDIIMAYPGEDESDARATINMIRKIQFDGAFSFKYSPRPGTEADKEDMVDPDTAQERLDELQEIQKEITYNKNKALERSLQEILVEGQARREGQYFGRTRGNKIVNFMGDCDIAGKLIKLRIKEAKRNSLYGEMV